DAMRGRGRDWLTLARGLDVCDQPLPPAPRPAPRPAARHRMRELSVTSIETLIRDPYAIYARYILRFRALDPLRVRPDARIRGQVLHRIVERVVGRGQDGETAESGAALLRATAAEVLDDEVPYPFMRRLWLSTIETLALPFSRAELA